jgi:hypothetical protein
MVGHHHHDKRMPEPNSPAVGVIESATLLCENLKN